MHGTTPNRNARFRWNSGDLGTPRVDLEDKEAVRRALERVRPDDGDPVENPFD
jgi:hypothetical protein